MSDLYECLHCRQPVNGVHIPGRFISPTWVHLDDDEECRATFATPNFDRVVNRCRECRTTVDVRGYEDPRSTAAFGDSQHPDVFLCGRCVFIINERRKQVQSAGAEEDHAKD